MTDDLGKQRTKRASTKRDAELDAAKTEYAGQTKEGVPELAIWLTNQHKHSNKQMSLAAEHCRNRWNLLVVPAARIERTLAGEDSEHLIGWRKLLDEYRELYVEDGEQLTKDKFLRQVGSQITLVPAIVEYCSRCSREAVPGTGVCARHGGQWISAEDRAKLSEVITDRMLDLSNRAIHTITDLMDNAKSEDVRLRSAEAILNRSGFPVGVKIEVGGSIGIDISAAERAATVVQERLEQIAKTRAALTAAKPEENQTEAIEAEIVDEQPAVS